MSATHAVLPSDEESVAFARLAKALRQDDAPRLTLIQGNRQEDLPQSAVMILRRVADLLASGRGVTVTAIDAELTTREAAELLGVSRPTLIKLLDDGEISYTRPNSSRRVPLSEVLDYKERRRTNRRRLLADMTEESLEQGTYGFAPDDDEAAGG